ncbi:hypothetical protein [Arthrobacter sp. UYCo732]|uniref:hypothetical protein n=1 Tax=Arthrobacter sp. UYCo732 TaxID=3156336 RepID=UPI00339893DD
MTTDASPAKPMFEHFVPEAEPPIGTVASFHYSFLSGGGSSTGYLMRGPSGWSARPNPQRHDLSTWEGLTDLEARNADIQQRRPGSTAVFTTLDVRIHAAPPEDRVGVKARLVKLQHTVYSAAERVGIQTEGASHIDLVTAITNLAEVKS